MHSRLETSGKEFLHCCYITSPRDLYRAIETFYSPYEYIQVICGIRKLKGRSIIPKITLTVLNSQGKAIHFRLLVVRVDSKSREARHYGNPADRNRKNKDSRGVPNAVKSSGDHINDGNVKEMDTATQRFR